MTIFNFSLFNNENLIAAIKLEEESSSVDEFHITESDRNFRYISKPFLFDNPSPKVKLHRINADKYFVGPHLRLKRAKWFVTTEVNPWKNEAIQRNFGPHQVTPHDDDIVVMSDIDEIISRNQWEYLIQLVKEKGIITVKLHFTMYFFNLFSNNWPGPPDYSYRTFLMTGKHYKSLKISPDKLRKLGESGALVDSVYCPPEFAGFHHSWVGDRKFIANKLASYSHDHEGDLYTDNGINEPNLERILKSNSSVYGKDHKLEKRDDIHLLESVELRRNQEPFQHLFLK